MPGQVFRSLPAVTAAPADFTVPNAAEWQLIVVSATYDGTAAATPFLPAVQIIGPGGIVAATYVDPSVSVAAGGSAEVTFGPFLKARKGAAPAGGADLLNTILAAGADAVWKLDETSGTTAHDSSGNGFDLGVNDNAPNWGQVAGPPGTTTAAFSNTPARGLNRAAFAALGSGGTAFSVFGWANFTDTSPADAYTLVAQGTDPTIAFSTGWSIAINGSHLADPLKLQATSNDGTFANSDTFTSDSALTPATWYFLAVTYTGTTFHLYVNGVLQAGSSNRSWSPRTGIALGSVTHTVGEPSSNFEGRMSWWSVVPNLALTSTQLLAIMASVP